MHKYYGKNSNNNELREKDKYIIKIIIKSLNSSYLANEEWKREAYMDKHWEIILCHLQTIHYQSPFLVFLCNIQIILKKPLSLSYVTRLTCAIYTKMKTYELFMGHQIVPLLIPTATRTACIHPNLPQAPFSSKDHLQPGTSLLGHLLWTVNW